MTYTDIAVLIPSHSLEDFPTELPDPQAESLLNAFAIVWHPVLLHHIQKMPKWDRSDEPSEELENQLFVVPTASDDWLPGGWVGYAEKNGAAVISGLSDRDEMAEKALAPLEHAGTVDPDLVADFYALGTCWLQMELLTRHMHYYSNLDEDQLERESLAAAAAAIDGNAEQARNHLRVAFESLLEARERFYPVECYLIDLCLLIPRLVEEQKDDFTKTITGTKPVNLIATAEEYREIAEKSADVIEPLKSAWENGTLNLLGGEWQDAPLPLLPINSVLWQFSEGQKQYEEMFGRVPRSWGRRRFGLTTQLPQVLTKFGYHSALHLVMDDGLYPDEDESKLRWEGADQTIIDALGRFPMTAEGPSSYLKLAHQIAESMERDQVAGVVFARWPEIKAPWFEDLTRMQSYAPVLGRFVTLDDFIENTDDPGRLSAFEQKEYLPPFFIQAAARQEPNPISRWATFHARRRQLDAALWSHALSKILYGQPIDDTKASDIERLSENAGPDREDNTETGHVITEAQTAVDDFAKNSHAELTKVVMSGAGNEPGVLLLNPLPHERTVSVHVPGFVSAPPLTDGVKRTQFDDRHQCLVADIPGSGFLWIPADGLTPPAVSKTPLAEHAVLRNEFFEVFINEATGGIARIKNYGRTPNRLSQQVGYRFPHERTFPIGEPDDQGERDTATSYYSEMRCQSLEVTSAGPALGEIVSKGQIIDQKDEFALADFTQTVRVWRHRPVVEVELDLDVHKTPDADPWTNYYALRFAWNDSTAALTRSVQDFAFDFRGERFDSPDYLEIAEDEMRTTLLFHGMPFHRKTGPRMLDTLLITAGESKRHFRFDIAIDQSYPLVAAKEAMTPVIQILTENGPPASGKSGWFFHVSAKNVQMLGIKNAPDGNGFVVRLAETEGRNRDVWLRCFRSPASARSLDFEGNLADELTVEDDAVHVPMHGYEMTDVHVKFE